MKKIHVWRAPFLLGGALMLAPLTPALAQGGPAVSAESTKKVEQAASEKLRYVGQLIRLDETQIALGRLALSHSDNLRVRQLAQNLVDAHTAHLDQLGQWARLRAQELRTAAGLQPEMGVGGAGTAGVPPSMAPPTGAGGTETESGLAGLAGTMQADAQRAQEHRAMLSTKYADLMKKSGHAFDKDWLDAVRDTNNDALSLVRDGIDKYASDASFASLLTKTEPIIQHSLRFADQLEPKLK